MPRNPTPTEIKIKSGNPNNHPINKNEPKPRRGIPQMPRWLESYPIAVEEWNREAEELDLMGVMTLAEVGVLSMRCYIAEQIQQEAKRQRDKADPYYGQIKNLITEHRQLGSLLGLDPSSRSRLSAIPKDKVSKFEGLVSIGGKK